MAGNARRVREVGNEATKGAKEAEAAAVEEAVAAIKQMRRDALDAKVLAKREEVAAAKTARELAKVEAAAAAEAKAEAENAPAQLLVDNVGAILGVSITARTAKYYLSSANGSQDEAMGLISDYAFSGKGDVNEAVPGSFGVVEGGGEGEGGGGDCGEEKDDEEVDDEEEWRHGDEAYVHMDPLRETFTDDMQLDTRLSLGTVSRGGAEGGGAVWSEDRIAVSGGFPTSLGLSVVDVSGAGGAEGAGGGGLREPRFIRVSPVDDGRRLVVHRTCGAGGRRRGRRR
jgi:hypothetical protein